MDIDDLDDAVLYDVFYESGTMLGGRLVALERKAEQAGDESTARSWKKEHSALIAERASISPSDRASMIACKRRWDDRRMALRDALYAD